MKSAPTVLSFQLSLAALCAVISGCGTTKWSDSPRTATEQLLVSDAIDRAISEIDFSALADKEVYLDTRFIITALDQNYVISTLRQHMLASGCIIKDKPDECAYVVEVRTGSVGTNRQDLLFGVPSTTLPTAGFLPTGNATIPEIALMKRTNQQGVCKLAVFAYDRMSGKPVWQSGNRKVASRAKDTWVMGAGPFQRGTIYDGTAFAGDKLSVPLVSGSATSGRTSVAEQKSFMSDDIPDAARMHKVENAGYNAPATGNPPATLPAGPAAAPAAAPAATGTTPPTTPPKAAYTPPPPPAVAPPPPPALPTGPQGNLATQNVLTPNANPAAATAGAIQTYNWAKDIMDRKQTPAN